MRWRVSEGSIEPSNVMDEDYWEYIAKLDVDEPYVDQATCNVAYVQSLRKIFFSFNFDETRSKELMSFLNENGVEGNFWSIENVKFNSPKDLYDFVYMLAELLVEEQECWERGI